MKNNPLISLLLFVIVFAFFAFPALEKKPKKEAKAKKPKPEVVITLDSAFDSKGTVYEIKEVK